MGRLMCGLCLSLCAQVSPVYAQLTVCGIDVSTIEGYGWNDFEDTDGLSQALATFQPDKVAKAISSKAIRLSPQWPFAMAQAVVKTSSDVTDGKFMPADFKVAKRVDGLQTKQFAFLGTASEIELPPNASAAVCTPDPISVAKVGAFVSLSDQAYATTLTPAYKQSSKQFALLEKQYEKYLFEGFPMWPWEAWANGELLTDDSIANGPPRNQLALFHPSAGVLASIESDADNDMGFDLMVEVLGWIRYSQDYDTWWGVSAAAVLPFDRDPGYGMAFTYKQFKLGVTWHDDDEYDGVAVVLNVDLLQFVSKKYKDYSGYLQKINDLEN